MKSKKEDTVTTKKSILKKVAKSKRQISTPKAGASLEKAVKNVQQIFKKNAEAKAAKRKKTGSTILLKSKSLKKKKLTHKPLKEKKQKNRGIVYVGHVPHGFYEEQMKDYFDQFGKVTRVRVTRSKKTGKSRGYGYVEFLHTEVAKIAADTMNNYLMCGRLLKAIYVPPERQHRRFFAGTNWSEEKYPKLKNRHKVTLHRNNSQSTEDHKKYVERSLHKLSELESKLQNKGISIKFQPVDVPQT